MDKTDIQKHNTVKSQNCEVRKVHGIKRFLVLQPVKEVKVFPETLLMVLQVVLVPLTILIVEETSVIMVALVADLVVMYMLAMEIVIMILVRIKEILEVLCWNL